MSITCIAQPPPQSSKILILLLETSCGLPGLGRFLVDASSQRYYPVVQGVHLLMASIVLLINLLVDVTYASLGPRIRYQSVVCLTARGAIAREGSL